ncbi:MAG: hypothetical protein ACI9YU_001285 [Flavobacteriales bacterium]|jgi:hypothetical protein
MRNLILLLSFVLVGNQAWSMGFTTLSSTEAVAVIIEIQQKSFVDILLDVDLAKLNRKSLALRIKCTINGSEFNEYITLKQGQKGAVKRILMNEGELLKAELFLHESGLKELMPVIGSFDVTRVRSEQVGESVSANMFIGCLWPETQLPIFRVIKEDEVKKTLSLTFNFTDQYEYDQFFYKLKVISPSDGILLYEKSIEVNASQYVTRNPKSVRVDLSEIPVLSSGTYYFQVQHDMNSSYINGVKSVEYKLIEN